MYEEFTGHISLLAACTYSEYQDTYIFPVKPFKDLLLEVFWGAASLREYG